MATTKFETNSVSQNKAENAKRALFVKALSSEIISAVHQKLMNAIVIPNDATELFIKLKKIGFWYDFAVVDADCDLLVEVSFNTSHEPKYYSFTALTFKDTRPPALEEFALEKLWEDNTSWKWRLYGTAETVSIRELFPDGLEFVIPLSP